ncbi:MAG: ABC transporter permease, partial [Bryobacteraceae bacterium]
MAADLTVRSFALPDEPQQRAMERLESLGVRRTWVTETFTMAASNAVPDPVLVSIKAVDPAVYPFYGVIKLDPDRPLVEAVQSDTIVASNDLLLRLRLSRGDTVRLGGQDFRLAAVVTVEPDRMSGTLNVGPRVMMSRAGLERTGLIRFGSRAAQRYLFHLPPKGATVERTRATLKRAFPEAQVVDFRETHPTITRGLDRATTFLTLVSLIALIVG